VFKRLHVRTEEDLMGYEIDNAPYASNVTLYSIEAKLLCEDVKACSVLRGIVYNGIAEVLLRW
jgi:hypothetical protein